MGISLAALAGLPPSPLFVSEVLIVAGGFQAGRPWEAARDRAPARARLPRTRARADRDHRRRQPPARTRSGRRASWAHRTHGHLDRAAPRPRSCCGGASRLGSRRRARARALVTPYRDRIESALADGWRFAGLHATSNGARVRTLLAGAGGETRLETVATDEGTAPSIVDLVPAAGWDEREAHDLQGVRFAGHEPLRPLVDHSSRARALGAAPRRRRLRGRRRADPRRRDRVGPLPLPPRRRSHSPSGRAALLQAPRARASRRREDARRRARLRRRAPAPPARSRTASPMPTPARRRSGSCRLPSSPAPARSCSSSSGCGAT